MMPGPLRGAKRSVAAALTNQSKRGKKTEEKIGWERSAEENASQEDQFQPASFTPVSSRR
jgi:hypothetical protein